MSSSSTEPSCEAPRRRPVPDAPAAPGEPVAACVLCGEDTEYPASVAGAPLCPRCEWQQDQRNACSG